jgi:membrane protease YdiL (CAAX protease family)
VEKSGDHRTSPWLRPELVASWRETWIVLGTFGGYFFFSAVFTGMQRSLGHTPWMVDTNGSMLRNTAMEGIMLAALFVVLRHRSWRAIDVGIRRTIVDTILGITFAVALIGMFVAYVWGLHLIGEFPRRQFLPSFPLHRVPAPLNLSIVAMNVIVNAYYEEVLMTGYVFTQFAVKRGPFIALGLVVLIRIGFHLWKDPIFLPFTALHFTLAGLLYWRTRNLWPILVSHAVYDLVVYLPAILRHSGA